MSDHDDGNDVEMYLSSEISKRLMHRGNVQTCSFASDLLLIETSESIERRYLLTSTTPSPLPQGVELECDLSSSESLEFSHLTTTEPKKRAICFVSLSETG